MTCGSVRFVQKQLVEMFERGKVLLLYISVHVVFHFYLGKEVEYVFFFYFFFIFFVSVLLTE